MPFVVTPKSSLQMARELWEWEGARAVPRLLSGLLLVAVCPVGWVGGLVIAAYVVGNLEELSSVVMGVAIGVAVEVGGSWGVAQTLVAHAVSEPS